MARLGGAQGDFHRGTITHFTDQNHLGRLAERGAQAGRKGIEIGAQLALVDGGHLLRIDEFNRVFQRDHVDG